MTNRSSNLIAAVVALCALVLPAATARAAEVRVLTSVALKSVLDELAPGFEQATGNKLIISYDLAAEQKKRILAGEPADVIMLTRAMMEDLQKQKLAGTLVNVAGTPVAIVARAGAPKPDIGTVEALKKTLLAARSIVYADPARGGLSGVVFARALERLGIAAQMKPKTILVPGAQAAEMVAKGEVELGVGQASEIVPVVGAQLVGPLPGELASTTRFTAAVGTATKSPEAAKALIEFLAGPQAAPRLRAKGFEPG